MFYCQGRFALSQHKNYRRSILLHSAKKHFDHDPFYAYRPSVKKASHCRKSRGLIAAETGERVQFRIRFFSGSISIYVTCKRTSSLERLRAFIRQRYSSVSCASQVYSIMLESFSFSNFVSGARGTDNSAIENQIKCVYEYYRSTTASCVLNNNG